MSNRSSAATLLLLLIAGCYHEQPAFQVYIADYGSYRDGDHPPIEVDTSQLPPGWTVERNVGMDQAVSSPVRSVYVTGGPFKVVLVPTTRPAIRP